MGCVMSRYTDADALIERWNNMSVRGRTEFDQEIIVTSTIDIVRCTECKYQQQCHKAVEHTTRDWTSVTIAYRPIEFCSYGEREGE